MEWLVAHSALLYKSMEYIDPTYIYIFFFPGLINSIMTLTCLTFNLVHNSLSIALVYLVPLSWKQYDDVLWRPMNVPKTPSYYFSDFVRDNYKLAKSRELNHNYYKISITMAGWKGGQCVTNSLCQGIMRDVIYQYWCRWRGMAHEERQVMQTCAHPITRWTSLWKIISLKKRIVSCASTCPMPSCPKSKSFQ